MRMIAISGVLLLATTGAVSAQAPGAYATVNGVRMYYETHGPDVAGQPPVVLLHGGVGGLEMFGPNLPALAQTRRVIAVDLQGHGRTSDVDRPFRYELMADDIAALVRQLGIEHADVVGYSLGGGVAMQTAIRHPDVVRRLVVIGAPFARHAFYPEVRAAFDAMDASAGAQMSQSPLASLYPAVDWANLFGKLGDLLRQDYDWSEHVAGIEAPVMLVFADADAVRPAHIAEFYSLVGGGRGDAGLDGSGRTVDRLAILPGTTHYDILGTVQVAELIEPFLAASGPADR